MDNIYNEKKFINQESAIIYWNMDEYKKLFKKIQYLKNPILKLYIQKKDFIFKNSFMSTIEDKLIVNKNYLSLNFGVEIDNIEEVENLFLPCDEESINEARNFLITTSKKTKDDIDNVFDLIIKNNHLIGIK